MAVADSHGARRAVTGSEDALSADEEVAEDRDLLTEIERAVRSVTGAKGADAEHVASLTRSVGMREEEAEGHILSEKSSDVVLGLMAAPNERNADDGEGELWPEHETHEGCSLFGYVDVSRAPGTLHISPHSSRHSFDFSTVNTTHHIDHLSFGLELTARERSYLPKGVKHNLSPLDGKVFRSTQAHETLEHHVNIMTTAFPIYGQAEPVNTFQFTATSHARARDTLPSLIVSYDVSPIQATILDARKPWSDFVVSLCAIIGGAFSIFGIVDAMYYGADRAIRKKLAVGKLS